MTEFPPVPDDAEITPPDADGYVWAHWSAEGVSYMVNLSVCGMEPKQKDASR